jgi:hypothetical protein
MNLKYTAKFKASSLPNPSIVCRYIWEGALKGEHFEVRYIQIDQVLSPSLPGWSMVKGGRGSAPAPNNAVRLSSSICMERDRVHGCVIGETLTCRSFFWCCRESSRVASKDPCNTDVSQSSLFKRDVKTTARIPATRMYHSLFSLSGTSKPQQGSLQHGCITV